MDDLVIKRLDNRIEYLEERYETLCNLAEEDYELYREEIEGTLHELQSVMTDRDDLNNMTLTKP